MEEKLLIKNQECEYFLIFIFCQLKLKINLILITTLRSRRQWNDHMF